MSRISEIAREMKTWWSDEGSDIEVQDALDEIIRLDEAEQTEPNCQECMWCADGEQTCPNPNLCYYAPRQTEPSTEAITGLPGPCIGCLKEICAGCDFQKAKEAWRKSQADCGWK